MKTRIIASIVGAVAVLGFATTAPKVEAVTSGPSPVITCDNLVVHLGETLHCTVSNTAGYTPSDKITWTNPRTYKTNNVANLAGQSFNVTYTPSDGEVGRNEVLQATIYLPAEGHIVRPVTGYTYFSVVAAVAPAPVAVAAPSTLLVAGSCHGYLYGNNSAYAYCSQGGTAGYESMNIVIRCQDGSYWAGPRVYATFTSSQAYCPAGLIVTSWTVNMHLHG